MTRNLTSTFVQLASVGLLVLGGSSPAMATNSGEVRECAALFSSLDSLDSNSASQISQQIFDDRSELSRLDDAMFWMFPPLMFQVGSSSGLSFKTSEIVRLHRSIVEDSKSSYLMNSEYGQRRWQSDLSRISGLIHAELLARGFTLQESSHHGPNLLTSGPAHSNLDKVIKFINEKLETTIVVGENEVILSGAMGVKMAHENLIVLSPYVLGQSEAEFIDILIHEARHASFANRRRRGIFSPFDLELKFNSSGAEVYGRYFSLDELAIYRRELLRIKTRINDPDITVRNAARNSSKFIKGILESLVPRAKASLQAALISLESGHPIISYGPGDIFDMTSTLPDRVRVTVSVPVPHETKFSDQPGIALERLQESLQAVLQIERDLAKL